MKYRDETKSKQTNFNHLEAQGEECLKTPTKKLSSRLLSSVLSISNGSKEMYRGFVKLWRKEKDWAFSSNPLAVALWVFLLREANHDITRKEFKGEIIDVFPGQLITGRVYISALTGISESQVERLLNKFESEQQLTQQKTNKNRLITILNWSKYQGQRPEVGQQKDNRRTTEGQQKDTPKNVKNDKNEKKENGSPEIIKEDKLDIPYDIEGLCERELSRLATKFMVASVKSRVAEKMHWVVDRYIEKKYKSHEVSRRVPGYDATQDYIKNITKGA